MPLPVINMSSPSPSPSPLSVLLVGATGALGAALAEGLLHPRFRTGLKLSLLVRQETATTAGAKKDSIDRLRAAGASIVIGDVHGPSAALVQALKGVDVVVCALNIQQVVSGELPLIAAAKAAGVGWFIPSEFGFDIDAIAALGPLEKCALPALVMKQQAREAVRAAGMDYTWVLSSIFTEWLLPVSSPSLLGYDPTTFTFNVPGSLDNCFSTIALPDLAASLGDAIVTGRGRNTTLRLAATYISYRDLVALVERVSGRQWKVVIKTPADYAAVLATKPTDLFARFGAFGAAQQGVAWPVESTYNYKHGLQVTTLEQFAEKVVPKATEAK